MSPQSNSVIDISNGVIRGIPNVTLLVDDIIKINRDDCIQIKPGFSESIPLNDQDTLRIYRNNVYMEFLIDNYNLNTDHQTTSNYTDEFILLSNTDFTHVLGYYNQELITDHDENSIIISSRNRDLWIEINDVSYNYQIPINSNGEAVVYTNETLITTLSNVLQSSYNFNFEVSINDDSTIKISNESNKFKILEEGRLFYRLGFTSDTSNNLSQGSSFDINISYQTLYQLTADRSQYPEIEQWWNDVERYGGIDGYVENTSKDRFYLLPESKSIDYFVANLTTFGNSLPSDTGSNVAIRLNSIPFMFSKNTNQTILQYLGLSVRDHYSRLEDNGHHVITSDKVGFTIESSQPYKISQETDFTGLENIGLDEPKTSSVKGDTTMGISKKINARLQ